MEGNRHIAPIGWGTNYQGSAILNQGQHPLGIVFRKYAILRGAAFHAADAEADVPVLGKFDMNDCSQPGGLFFHQFKPFGKYCRSSSGCRRKFDFLPFLVALAGFVSCDEFKPEVAVGCVTVDNEYSCALTSAIGGDIRPFAKFVISILRQNDFL